MATSQRRNPVRISEECTICTDDLRNPKVLSCRHVFCELCLKLWIEKQTKAGPKRSVTGIECPLCRRICEPTESTVDPSEWASMLPDATSAEEDLLFCEPCQSSSDKNLAKFFCTECNEYLCSQCQKTHKKLKISRSHKTVETTAKARSRIPLYVEYNKLLKCDAHAGKHIEFFCKDHDKVFCSTCAFLHHRTCSNIIEIENNTDKVSPGKPLVFSVRVFEALRNSIWDIVDKREEFRTEVESNESDMNAKLERMKKALLKKFKEFETVVRDSYVQQNEKVKASNAEQITKLSAIGEKLESFVNTTKEIIKIGLARSSPDYIIATRQLDFQYGVFFDEAKNFQPEDFTSFVFQENDGFLSCLNDSRLLGTVVEKTSNIKPPQLQQEKPLRDKTFQISHGKLRMPVSRKDSYFSSACYLSGHDFVFLDGSKKTILLCQDNTKAETLKIRMKSEPSAVTCSKKVMYVSFPSERTVRKYDIHKGFKDTGQFKTNHRCFTLSFSEHMDRLVSSSLRDDDHWELVSFDRDGNEVSVLSNVEGRELKSLQHCLVVEGTVYQSSREDNKVYAFSLEDGASIFAYEHTDLKCPGGVGSDSDLNIYICGMVSGNIHIVTKQGTPVKIVELTYQGIIAPTNIYFSENGEDVLVLGNTTKPGPFVYKLSNDSDIVSAYCRRTGNLKIV